MFRHLPLFGVGVNLSLILYGLLTFDPLTVGNQLLDLHSHKENQLVIAESKLSESGCVAIQIPQEHSETHPDVTFDLPVVHQATCISQSIHVLSCV